MNLCYFIVDATLMTTERGVHRMPTFSDEHMNKLFERFVLNYYRREYPEYRPNADEIKWNVAEEESCGLEYLPGMHSDITLHHDSSTLIIDTKYYGRMMQRSQYEKGRFILPICIRSSLMSRIATPCRAVRYRVCYFMPKLEKSPCRYLMQRSG